MNGAHHLPVGGHIDRRRRVRLRLNWRVQFMREEMSSIEATTRDISSDGFFCLADTLLHPGETLMCMLWGPAYDPHSPDRMLMLECRVKVLRALPSAADGLFGIACRIEDYRFLH